MKTTRGKHRVLTDAQVERVLVWHARMEVWQRRREQVPTLRAFALANSKDHRTITRLLPTLDQKIELLLRTQKWSRALRKLLAERAQIGTMRGLARELGVSERTVADVARRRGEYKQASPEMHNQVRAQRRAHLNRLKRMHLY